MCCLDSTMDVVPRQQYSLSTSGTICSYLKDAEVEVGEIEQLLGDFTMRSKHLSFRSLGWTVKPGFLFSMWEQLPSFGFRLLLYRADFSVTEKAVKF